MFLKNRNASWLLIALLALGGCSRNSGSGNEPQQRLTDYIAASFTTKDSKDRQKMQEYLTGSAKSRLVAWSDEQFRQAFVDNRRQFRKLAIREVKKSGDKEANVTYELTYLDPSKGSEAVVTNKRMAEMVLENGHWFIREVHNIKELIEYKNEMSIGL